MVGSVSTCRVHLTSVALALSRADGCIGKITTAIERSPTRNRADSRWAIRHARNLFHKVVLVVNVVLIWIYDLKIAFLSKFLHVSVRKLVGVLRNVLYVKHRWVLIVAISSESRWELTSHARPTREIALSAFSRDEGVAGAFVQLFIPDEVIVEHNELTIDLINWLFEVTKLVLKLLLWFLAQVILYGRLKVHFLSTVVVSSNIMNRGHLWVFEEVLRR